MNRFLLFNFTSAINRPLGGMNDFIGYVSGFDEARELSEKKGHGQFVQLFDMETGIVFANEKNPKTGRWSEWDYAPISHAANPTYIKPELWTHLKRGGIYMVDPVDAKLQINDADYDGAEVVVYTSLITGARWVRIKAEFYDGRFEKLDYGDMTLAQMVTETARIVLAEHRGHQHDQGEVNTLKPEAPAPDILEWREVSRRDEYGNMIPMQGRFLAAVRAGLFQIRPVDGEVNAYTATFTKIGQNSPEFMTARKTIADAKIACAAYFAGMSLQAPSAIEPAEIPRSKPLQRG